MLQTLPDDIITKILDVAYSNGIQSTELPEYIQLIKDLKGTPGKIHVYYNRDESLKFIEQTKEQIADLCNNFKIHLDLSGCKNIMDVSMLGSVYKLNLSGCKNIMDVSAWFCL